MYCFYIRMNKITSLNYSIYNLCLKCRTVFRLNRVCTMPLLSKNVYWSRVYSSNRHLALNHEFGNEMSEIEIQSNDIKENIVEKVNSKKKTSERKVKKQNQTSVVRYINSLETLANVKDVITSALHEKEKAIYLTDRETAKHLSDLFAPDLKNSDSLIIEANPGLGFLTRELLQAGIPYIRLFESNVHFYEYLKNEKFPGNVDVSFKDIIRFWKMQFIDKKDGGGRMSRMFTGVTPKDWEDEPAVTVVAAIPDKKFISSIISNIVTKTGFVKFGRPQFYLILDTISYHNLTGAGNQDLRNYRSDSVLFQVLFDYQVLSRVPRKVFLPWKKDNKRFTKWEEKILNKDGDMYVIKLIPHGDLFSSKFDNHLPVFEHFVKQLFSSRTKRLMPQLEQWVPGCGPNMIAMGYDAYTLIKELTPKEILDIFFKFLSWDSTAENSSFFASMDSYFLKKQNPDDINDDD